MSHLFYSSTAVYRSYVLLLDEAEQVLRTCGTPFFLVCDGSHTSYCFGNVSGNVAVCRCCRFMRRKGLNALSKQVQCVTIRDLLDTADIRRTTEMAFDYRIVKDIYDIRYKGVDIGYAALSHYICCTRNYMPSLTPDLRIVIDGFLRTAIFLTDAIERLIHEHSFQSVSLFNGRTFDTRPVLRKCVAAGVKTNVFELIGFGEQVAKVCFPDALPQDVAMQGRWIKDQWHKATARNATEAVEIGHSFFQSKRHGIRTGGDRVYTAGQRKDELPVDWDPTKQNIVFFSSSEDEYVAIDDEWERGKYTPSQLSGVRRILELLRDQGDGYHVYVRLHPNLAGVPFAYHTDFYKLTSDYTNVTVIPPDSSVSTYALLDNAAKVVVYGTTVGIEAVYWGKPVILIGMGCYRELGACYIPADDADFKNMLTHELTPKDRLPAIIYGYSVMGDVGMPFLHFDYSLFWPDLLLRGLVRNRRLRSFLLRYTIRFFRWFSLIIRYACGSFTSRSLRKITADEKMS